jgi:RNA polymerase sigma-70 factor (ECF subfamily)
MAERDAADADLRLYLTVLRCQAGDERAFAELVDRFGARTLAYLRGLLGDDGEDVQQEVWLAVYRGLRSLVDPRAFRTWLFRTTRHRAIDWLRARRRERELLDELAGDAPRDEAPPADDDDAPTLDDADLARAMAALAPIHREVLLLRHRDDLSYAEIALVVGVSLGTVRSRLHHARLRLHHLMQPTGDVV